MADEQRIEIPLSMVGADASPVMFVNHLVIQHDRNEFILTFGQMTPPLLLGTPEQQVEQIKALPYIPVRIVGRFSLTPQRLGEFIRVMQENLQGYEQERANHMATISQYGTTTSSLAVFTFGAYVGSAVVDAPIELQAGATIGKMEPLSRPAHSQAYFWMCDWQLDEGRAERERDAGQAVAFDDVEDAIRWLNEPEQ